MARTGPGPERVAIADVRPSVNGGRYAVKRIAGDLLRVTADIIKEGQDQLRAEVELLRGDKVVAKYPMTYSFDDDEWSAEVQLAVEPGAYSYRVAAWTDTYGSWVEELTRKVEAGREVSSEVLEGLALLEAASSGKGSKAARAVAQEAVTALKAAGAPEAQVAAASEPRVISAMRDLETPPDRTTSAALPLTVDRERARFGAWYEMFPRSYGSGPNKHGTFRTAATHLPRIREMGFDVLYLPPIHPIGHTNRKGKNNALKAARGDVGSPWAIGSEAGGHDAVEPALGTLEDFRWFVGEARGLGMEVALDFAIQCSPDHPYVREHPEWFKRRPDGTVKYAENPPKKYEDIVALDMWCEDWKGLWNELRRVVLHWVDQGVEVFRVDNPHTKPMAFWEWLIGEVKREHPDVVFLSEAFTRPKKLELLAKLGFSQSYGYFTWRNTREELETYLTELTRTERADFLRPNFFANTPDILHEYIQTGGPPAFKIRAVLAATLSPAYGIYSGFELCEAEPLHHGSEEYLNSEKYELRWRDWDDERSLAGYLARVNAIRSDNPALRGFTNLDFHNSDNPSIISYSKCTADRANRILAVVTLDPHRVQEGLVYLDSEALGIVPGQTYVVRDLVTAQQYEWTGLVNYVRLDPARDPAHLFRVEPA